MTDAQRHLTGYADALSGAVIYPVPQPGFLRIAGRDRLDFVQRQTTNDARALAPGRSLLTVLTSPTARILDVWRLLPEDEAIGVLTLPGRGAPTARYLQGRIFFMDKVTVEDASARAALFHAFGPQAPAVLQAAGLADLPAPDQVMEAALGGMTVRAIGQHALGSGWLLLSDAESANALAAHLAQAGFAPLSDDAYEVLRVEGGWPGPHTEMTDDATPLEVNLLDAISDRKGCYTGQEVIARQVNYDKVTRRLVGLRLGAPVPPGARVEVEGRSTGTVTSSVVSPRFGPLALAILKRPHFEPGTPVAVRDDARSVAAVTAALPFE